ncbi:DUF1793-domain-containing protein [Pseudovirgaria hyperparasitica]|uniref:DUF1793-domain-containing protein n=1 Tax=Pseudovirgaria hyperparasitica TaxID=470096 RepID=A0A6A6W4K1_9PEZI|nr:DUF1793-domain-containing protein [Pseudovirgaria hyperparasitica]KAF2757858.1 DUF1793-domain-containing protein [Pseudovirgaria hyperparasitica]
MKLSCFGCSTSICALLASVAEASTLTPPILPLFVRTPYFNSWLANARDVPWSHWPIFWTGGSLGMAIMASSPDTKDVYPLLGRVQDFLETDVERYNVSYPDYKGASYDASTTNLTYMIPAPTPGSKPLELKLSFLSPITPTSTLRQSIPAAYLTVYVSGDFDLDIYIDVNGEWVSGTKNAKIEWELLNNGDARGTKLLKTWKVNRAQQLLYTEIYDQSEWGHLLFSAPAGVRHEAGRAKTLRQRFSRTGTLQNQVDNDFRGVMEREPVFAFSKSFKLAQNSSTTATKAVHDKVQFTLAHMQDPVVQFASARGLLHAKPLWKSWFLTDEKVIDYHYLDFHNAQALAQNYSDQLAADAFQSGSHDYVDIVALSARQVLGATSFSGTPDNPLLFLKEISSNGNTQTVDVIFPAFPFFLYTNPRWLSYLLEPLIEHQLSGQYPNDYSMHDLGSHFPNETGHADGRDEYMPVEECGDMLIMGLALINSLMYSDSSAAQSRWSTVGSQDFDESNENPFSLAEIGTVDGIEYIDNSWGGVLKGPKQAKKWLKNSYRLWKQWTGYLVEFSLEPANQLCTDDFAGWLPLQTNLALKGIIGIKAMSELSSILGEDADAKRYKNISETYITKWEEYGMSRDGSHAKLAYDWYGSWTTLYSLYADAILCFHPSFSNSSAPTFSPAHSGEQKPISGPISSNSKDFIPTSIYKKQSDWYAAVMQKYGLPLDSRHLYTKSDWEFESAAVASSDVRKEILQRVAKWLNETVTDRPFTDLYNTEGDGGFPGPNFFARPVVGGHFAFLTLERACGGLGSVGILD